MTDSALDTIHPAFLPSAGFLAWLDLLPPTPRYAKILAARAKAEAAEAQRRQAEREAQWEASREQREQATREREAQRTKRRSWHHAKAKHIVTGRLHLMEDDDREHERTGYVEMNRFTTTERQE